MCHRADAPQHYTAQPAASLQVRSSPHQLQPPCHAPSDASHAVTDNTGRPVTSDTCRAVTRLVTPATLHAPSDTSHPATRRVTPAALSRVTPAGLSHTQAAQAALPRALVQHAVHKPRCHARSFSMRCMKRIQLAWQSGCRISGPSRKKVKARMAGSSCTSPGAALLLLLPPPGLGLPLLLLAAPAAAAPAAPCRLLTQPDASNTC